MTNPARTSARRLAILAVATACVAFAPAAHATDFLDGTSSKGPTADGPQDVKPLYRDGFMPGFALHSGFAHVSGYPNDARAINNPASYSSSDLMFGTTTTFHISYALTDYLMFGFMVNLDAYDSAHWRSRGEGFGIRVDAFPMLAFKRFAPKLHDLGIFLETGIGTVKLEPKVGSYPNSDGTQSYAATGVFYEITIAKFKASHLALAPEVKWTHIDSQSITADSISTGLRLAFYTGK